VWFYIRSTIHPRVNHWKWHFPDSWNGSNLVWAYRYHTRLYVFTRYVASCKIDPFHESDFFTPCLRLASYYFCFGILQDMFSHTKMFLLFYFLVLSFSTYESYYERKYTEDSSFFQTPKPQKLVGQLEFQTLKPTKYSWSAGISVTKIRMILSVDRNFRHPNE
jgi:hypothetical protein